MVWFIVTILNWTSEMVPQWSQIQTASGQHRLTKNSLKTGAGFRAHVVYVQLRGQASAASNPWKTTFRLFGLRRMF